nr:MAG TPA: protein of unknown function (DUF5531) [Caudoviricetes sp.]
MSNSKIIAEMDTPFRFLFLILLLSNFKFYCL